MRKLKVKRLLIVTGLPTGIGLLVLIGWGMFNLMPGPLSPPLSMPVLLAYLIIGIWTTLVLAILCLIVYGFWTLFNWIFPKESKDK